MQRSILSRGKLFWKHIRAKNKKPKSRFRRITEAVGNMLALAYLLILCFPQVVFAHSVSYRNFRVYSTSPIDNNLYPIMDKAEQRLACSEINDPHASYRIFLCPSHAAFAFFTTPLQHTAFALNLTFVHNIFVNKTNIAADQVTTDTGKHDRRTLSSVIAHECTHTLLARRFGQGRVLLLPSWKQEGYCEYVAQAPSFDKGEGTTLLKQGRSDASHSFYYFKAFTAVAYLKDRRHWSVSRIMDTPLSLDKVIQEAMAVPEEKKQN